MDDYMGEGSTAVEESGGRRAKCQAHCQPNRLMRTGRRCSREVGFQPCLVNKGLVPSVPISVPGGKWVVVSSSRVKCNAGDSVASGSPAPTVVNSS